MTVNTLNLDFKSLDFSTSLLFYICTTRQKEKSGISLIIAGQQIHILSVFRSPEASSDYQEGSTRFSWAAADDLSVVLLSSCRRSGWSLWKRRSWRANRSVHIELSSA